MENKLELRINKTNGCQPPGINTNLNKIEGQPAHAVKRFTYLGYVLKNGSSVEKDENR